MTGWRLAIAAMAFCLARLASAQNLPAPGDRPDSADRPLHSERPAPAVSADSCVAILGQVQKPGTYVLKTLEVQELISAAGGLTPEATSNLRIVRGGRGSQKVFFDPSATCVLRGGDVVVAEGSRTGNASTYLGRVATGNIVPGRLAAPSYESKRVTVAFVGLQDWPVVTSHLAEDAFLQTILTQWNQSAKGKAKLIVEGAPVELAIGNVPLKNDTVVILPREQIDRQQLPKLPQPILPAAAPRTVSSETATPVADEAPALPNKLPEPGDVARLPAPAETAAEPIPAMPAPLAADRPEPPLDIPGTIDDELPAFPGERPRESNDTASEPAQDSAVPEPKERADVPAIGIIGWFRTLPTPMVFLGASALFMALLTAMSMLSKPVREEPVSVAAVSPPVAAEPPVAARQPIEVPIAAPQMVVAPAPVSAATVEPLPQPVRPVPMAPAVPAPVAPLAAEAAPPAAASQLGQERLQRLIANAWSITEEAVEFPAAVRLLGQPLEAARHAATRPEPSRREVAGIEATRIDNRESLPQPHFGNPAEPVAADVPPAPQRTLRVDRTPPSRGVLDRALASVQKVTRKQE